MEVDELRPASKILFGPLPAISSAAKRSVDIAVASALKKVESGAQVGDEPTSHPRADFAFVSHVPCCVKFAFVGTPIDRKRSRNRWSTKRTPNHFVSIGQKKMCRTRGKTKLGKMNMRFVIDVTDLSHSIPELAAGTSTGVMASDPGRSPLGSASHGSVALSP